MSNFVSSTNELPSAPFVAERFNEGGARELLSELSWPNGLQDTFIKNLSNIGFRYFICDDSGSMTEPDGSYIYGSPKDINRK
jgi:hypothetical protein